MILFKFLTLFISFFICLNATCQMVDGGNGHSIILDKNGIVFTIGRNNFGQLGNGSNENSPEPIKVSNLPKVKSISRGYDHSIAIDSTGKMWLWGRNNYGQLGTSMTLDYDTPQKLVGHSNFVLAEGGHWHTVALKEDGSVWTWGHNFYGELGNGTREHSSFPTQVVLENGQYLKNIIDIVSVGYHTLALDKNGHIYSWGGNDFGELGHFKTKIQPFATKIDSLHSIVDIAVGWHHSVALNKEGKLFIWGSDPSTQDRESTGNFFQEIKELSDLPKMTKIACGSWHSLAIDENDEVWGWGKNHFGMLGTNDTVSYSFPKKLSLPKGICEIGGGCFQSLAMDTSGNIWTMGDNPSGQLGQGNFDRLLVPQKITLDSNSKLNISSKTIIRWGIIGLLFFSLILNILLFRKIKNMANMLSEIFETFHDGGIEWVKTKADSIEIKICCMYLAEMEKEGFENFYLNINNVKMFEFHIWGGNTITNIDVIGNLDLEISTAKILEKNTIQITCYHYDYSQQESSGGDFFINADFVSLKNHEKKSITPDKLFDMSSEYWKNLKS